MRLNRMKEFSRHLMLLASSGALLLLSIPAHAQITMLEEINGKTFACTRSGLYSDLRDCGVPDWYAYVFIGSITEVKTIQNDEQELHIVPEEVFAGRPDGTLTVLTSQGLCLPKLSVGDQWLFYLRETLGKPIVLDYGGNDSLPLERAKEQIETLRQLKTLGNFGLLRGNVTRGESTDGEPLPHANVMATRKTDQVQFLATTDGNGRYTFQPLPPGDYQMSVEKVGRYQPDDSEAQIKAGTCTDLTLSRSPHGSIRGVVKHTDGTPAANIDTVLMTTDGSWYETVQTDQLGKFEFEGNKAGAYIIGLNYPVRPDWFGGSGADTSVKVPPASLFYPGVTERSSAQVIQLKTDEQIDHLDFVIPKT